MKSFSIIRAIPFVLCGFMFLGCNGVSKETYGKLQTDYSNLLAEHDKLKQVVDATKQDLSGQNDELRRQLQDLAAQKQAKEQELTKMQETQNSLVSELKNEIQQGEVQITELKGKLTLNLVDRILFDPGESAVKKGGQQILDRVGAILKKVTDKQIRIEGHTDNIPVKQHADIYPTNWELSAARATNVLRYLADKAKVNQTLLSAVGYGEFKPVGDNKTAEGRAKNRRIEIVLVPLDQAITK